MRVSHFFTRTHRLTLRFFFQAAFFCCLFIVLRLLEGLAGSDNLASAEKSLPDVERERLFLLLLSLFFYLSKIYIDDAFIEIALVNDKYVTYYIVFIFLFFIFLFLQRRSNTLVNSICLHPASFSSANITELPKLYSL